MAPRVKFTREEFAEAGLSVVRKKGFSALTAQALVALRFLLSEE